MFRGDLRLLCFFFRVILFVNFIYDLYNVLCFNIFRKDIFYVYVFVFSYIVNCLFCIKDYIESSFYDIFEL